MDANWALVILTLALIGVTGFYVRETRLSRKASEEAVQEMREQRLAAVRPIVKLDQVEVTNPDPFGPDSQGNFQYPYAIKVYPRNIGVGPALNVQCGLVFPNYGSDATPKTVSALGKNESSMVELWRRPQDDLRTPHVQITVRVRYNDVYGDIAHFTETKWRLGPTGRQVVEEEMRVWFEKP